MHGTRNGLKPGSCLFAYSLFLAITFERKVFSKIHAVQMKKSLKEYRTYLSYTVEMDDVDD